MYFFVKVHNQKYTAICYRHYTDFVAKMAAGFNVRDYISRLLDTTGDGTGTKIANGNYASAEEQFKIVPAVHERFLLVRMIASIEDSKINADDYGAIANGLTNGIKVRVSDGSGVIVDLTDGLPIKTSAAWAFFCFDASQKAWGAGNEFLVARWTFNRSGTNILIDGDKGEFFEVVLNDDLTGLVDHRFIVQGFKAT